jgi:APA family basic amino acid/polyamine antiporter
VNDTRLSGRALFAVVYTTAVSAVYFAFGVIAHRALGLTPFVVMAGGLFFALTAMTYVEAASMHREAGGSTNFSRYAFNELVSFVVGWAIVLDYIILVAVCALAATNYLATFWDAIDDGALEVILAVGIVAWSALANIRGISVRRLQARVLIVGMDLALQVLLVVLGIFLVLDPAGIVQSIDLGTLPEWPDALFALTVGAVAFTGLEAAAALAGEVQATRASLKHLAGRGVVVIALVQVGVAFVGLSALPVEHGMTALGARWEDAPVVGIAAGLGHDPLGDILKYVVAAAGTITLVAGATSAMLGVSRTALALATHRQIPTGIGRLHPQRGTPWIVIVVAAVAAVGLVMPTDLEFLVGIYAFGAMLAFTIAHASAIRLRFREPDRMRPYRMPFSIRKVPVPAALGAALSLAGWISVVTFHGGARFVGLGWMAAGLILYVVYRVTQQTPLFERVTVPERALRVPAEAMEPEFGSILVPIFGSDFDVDIIQTAGRLAGDEHDDDLESDGAVIEALWVFEVPMALPLEARLPDGQLERAREALARAKAVGEEYEGVEVATATVRARRAGQAIVDEARRRGVEAIVLAAEPPSRIRGGGRLGGSGALDDYVGDVTKYVLRKAPCRVILTAPADDAKAPTTPT